jgi:hypothetical protein
MNGITPEIKSGYVFFACDTKSDAFQMLLQALKQIASTYGLELVTYESTIDGVKSTLNKVEDLINCSLCVIADVGCSPERLTNSNVAIEVGLAKALKRPLLLVASNPETLPANLRGNDILLFPQCITVGTQAFHQINSFFKHIGGTFLGGRNVRIFESRSDEYLDVLTYITSLSGNVWFVSPELRSFFRPKETLERWLREVRKYPPARIKSELERREVRHEAFLKNLQHSRCYDIYPPSAFDLIQWRGLSLSDVERKEYIINVTETLQQHPSYELAISKDTQKQKYWIKESQLGGFVIFEGWGYINVREHKEIGGLILRDPDTVKSFKGETEQLLNSSLHDKNQVVDYLSKLL